MIWLDRVAAKPLNKTAMAALVVIADEDSDKRLAAQEEMPREQRDPAAWMKSRVDATGRITDKRFLKRLAVYAPKAIREAAVKNPALDDQEFLARVSQEDPEQEWGPAKSALERVTDPAIIRRLAHDPDVQMRRQMGDKLGDLGLSDDIHKIALDPKHPLHEHIRTSSIEDPEVLHKLAGSSAVRPLFRYRALKKVNDPGLWKAFVADVLASLNGGNHNDKLLDFIHDLGSGGDDADLIVSHMTPEQVNEAADSGSNAIAEAAAGRVTDKELLERLLDSDYPDVAFQAMLKIDDRKLLATKLDSMEVDGDENWTYLVRRLLVKVNDQDQYQRFAVDGSDDIRQTVAEHLTDQAQLKAMWRRETSEKKYDSKQVMGVLLARITDQVFMAKLALTDPNHGFQALQRLDVEHLEDDTFARKFIEHFMKLESFDKRLDPNKLLTVMKHAKSQAELTQLMKGLPRRHLPADLAAKSPHQAEFEKPAVDSDKNGGQHPVENLTPAMSPRPQLLRLMLRLAKP